MEQLRLWKQVVTLNDKYSIGIPIKIGDNQYIVRAPFSVIANSIQANLTKGTKEVTLSLTPSQVILILSGNYDEHSTEENKAKEEAT